MIHATQFYNNLRGMSMDEINEELMRLEQSTFAAHRCLDNNGKAELLNLFAEKRTLLENELLHRRNQPHAPVFDEIRKKESQPFSF